MEFLWRKQTCETRNITRDGLFGHHDTPVFSCSLFCSNLTIQYRRLASRYSKPRQTQTQARVLCETLSVRQEILQYTIYSSVIELARISIKSWQHPRSSISKAHLQRCSAKTRDCLPADVLLAPSRNGGSSPFTVDISQWRLYGKATYQIGKSV